MIDEDQTRNSLETVSQTDMVDLSEPTRRHVRVLFDAPDVDAAEQLLARECADNLPLVADVDGSISDLPLEEQADPLRNGVGIGTEPHRQVCDTLRGLLPD